SPFSELLDRGDQHINALEQAQLADKEQVGCALAHHDRLKFVVGDAIVHDPHEAWWDVWREIGWLADLVADLGLEQVAAIGALEQEKISAAHERTFGIEINKTCWRAPAEMQAAAVRRVDADCLSLGGGGGDAQARIGAAFGAMPVNHVGTDSLGAL